MRYVLVSFIFLAVKIDDFNARTLKLFYDHYRRECFTFSTFFFLAFFLIFDDVSLFLRRWRRRCCRNCILIQIRRSIVLVFDASILFSSDISSLLIFDFVLLYFCYYFTVLTFRIMWFVTASLVLYQEKEKKWK